MSSAVGKIAIAGISGLAIWGIYEVVQAQRTSNAADKMDYDIDAFTLKETKKNLIGVPTSWIYEIDLKLNNQTDKDLIISKPYVKLSIKNNGVLKKIANTDIPAATEINIKANSSTFFKHEIEIRLTNLLAVLPNAREYIGSRITGAKSTQQIVADATVDAMGVTIPIQQIINL